MAAQTSDAKQVDYRVITRVGSFVDRDSWATEGMRCSIEQALDLVGTRSAMILLREAFSGVRRFDELVRRAGLSDSVAAKRLKELVEHGLFTQEPYRHSGSRTRYEYVLTERGRALFPVMVALMNWGDELDDGTGVVDLFHADCGAPVSSVLRCAAGHDVSLSDTCARQKQQGRETDRS
ncbi:helix-turn-helix domain-containing protein [Streptomyces sp. KS_5]|uniref:winged helix-turn-helix transcriptional regulator n=1 Tax=Streptomyces sp. KS_5 TaxID=1881018 RepID=UPI00089AE0FE|nr:helix-turn-helix domain-containing protein [Streptomyces sp. KS_5]SEE35248.1 transcriptional regulator, HxlR family [Streptomyces sp. KS_5]